MNPSTTFLRTALPAMSGLLLIIGAAHAQLVPIESLYSTGVDNDHNPLAANQPDLHYAVTGANGLAVPGHNTNISYSVTPYVSRDTGAFPFGNWMRQTNSTGSQWIQPGYSDGSLIQHSPSVTYVYTTTFDLSGYDSSTAIITFRVVVDNQLHDVRLNGFSTGLSYGYNDGVVETQTYRTWSPELTMDDYFVDGLNTLEFVTYNLDGKTGNPAALRVEMVLGLVGYAPIPEPSSAALLGIGVCGAACFLRRKRR